jgi:hypothetical protein
MASAEPGPPVATSLMVRAPVRSKRTSVVTSNSARPMAEPEVWKGMGLVAPILAAEADWPRRRMY